MRALGARVPLAFTVVATIAIGTLLNREMRSQLKSLFVDLRLSDLVRSLIVGCLSAGVLAAWLNAQPSNVVRLLPGPIANRHAATVLALIALFGLANAFAEEVVWRLVLPDLLRSRGVGTASSAVLCSSSFGIAHFYGVPWGFQGVALASLFGLSLTTLLLTGGSFASVVAAHFLVDVLIGYFFYI